MLKQSPILASTLGISVYRLKLFAYVVGAIPCGIAGVLFAFLSGYISPSSFTFTLALAVLTASIVGGSQSIFGAFFGAALLQLGPEQIGSSFQKYAADRLRRLPAAGRADLLRRRRRHRPLGDSGGSAGGGRAAAVEPGGRHPGPPPPPPSGGRGRGEHRGPGRRDARVEGATKIFGGVLALDEVTLEAAPGQITALIGPNGSGKTTLLNLVSGFYKPTSGTVRLGDQQVSGLVALPDGARRGGPHVPDPPDPEEHDDARLRRHRPLRDPPGEHPGRRPPPAQLPAGDRGQRRRGHAPAPPARCGRRRRPTGHLAGPRHPAHGRGGPHPRLRAEGVPLRRGRVRASTRRTCTGWSGPWT